jgi:nitrogen fixation protein
MKPFKSIIIVKHPLDAVWTTIRDRMTELVPMLEEVASIIVVDRNSDADGTVRLVNEWRVRLSIPTALGSLVKPEMLGWTDRAEWRESTHECCWAVEPFFLPQAVRCAGTTLYEPAIGGRGTRITFAGTLDVDRMKLGAVPVSLGIPVSAALETIVTTAIPKSFRKTTDAVEKLLGPRR